MISNDEKMLNNVHFLIDFYIEVNLFNKYEGWGNGIVDIIIEYN